MKDKKELNFHLHSGKIEVVVVDEKVVSLLEDTSAEEDPGVPIFRFIDTQIFSDAIPVSSSPILTIPTKQSLSPT